MKVTFLFISFFVLVQFGVFANNSNQINNLKETFISLAEAKEIDESILKSFDEIFKGEPLLMMKFLDHEDENVILGMQTYLFKYSDLWKKFSYASEGNIYQKIKDAYVESFIDSLNNGGLDHARLTLNKIIEVENRFKFEKSRGRTQAERSFPESVRHACWDFLLREQVYILDFRGLLPTEKRDLIESEVKTLVKWSKSKNWIIRSFAFGLLLKHEVSVKYFDNIVNTESIDRKLFEFLSEAFSKEDKYLDFYNNNLKNLSKVDQFRNAPYSLANPQGVYDAITEYYTKTGDNVRIEAFNKIETNFHARHEITEVINSILREKSLRAPLIDLKRLAVQKLIDLSVERKNLDDQWFYFAFNKNKEDKVTDLLDNIIDVYINSGTKREKLRHTILTFLTMDWTMDRLTNISKLNRLRDFIKKREYVKEDNLFALYDKLALEFVEKTYRLKPPFYSLPRRVINACTRGLKILFNKI